MCPDSEGAQIVRVVGEMERLCKETKKSNNDLDLQNLKIFLSVSNSFFLSEILENNYCEAAGAVYKPRH